MNGSNTPPIPPAMSMRAAAEALIGQIDRAADLMPVVVDITNASEALRATLDQPERSRPGLLPDVDHALGAIAAMKRGEPIAAEDIHAIVALAETGADELSGFDLRWKADMRAIAAWREAHPGNDLVLPDHADLVVWLMDVFDTTFDQPTVAQVEHVRARLGAAQLRAPNALTKDARDIVDQLADALRKTSRRAFMAEERARAAEAANVQWERDDHRGITHQHVETPNIDGWIVENGAGNRWRGWGDVGPIWVDDRDKAIRYARRQDAEAVHAEDEDAWRIIPFAQGGHADTEGEAMTMFAHLNCPICGGSGHIDDAKERLHERLVDLLTRELGDAYDCTRVWAAWEAGTMTADDFEPVTDRMDDLVEGLIAQLCAPDQVEADRESLDRVEARLDAEVLATVPAVERAPVPGVYPPDQGEPIGGKNTADYDRRQLEQRINDELQAIAARRPGERIGINVAAEVARFAPGWDFQTVDSISSAFPKVVLTRYAAGESA